MSLAVDQKKDPEIVLETDGVQGCYTGDAAGSTLAYLQGTFASPANVWVFDLERKKSSQLTPQDESLVLSAFDELGYLYLRPVFDMLEERIGFDQLHLWRLIYQVMSTEK